MQHFLCFFNTVFFCKVNTLTPKQRYQIYCLVMCFNSNLRQAFRVSEGILESGQTQQTFANPLTCCEGINSSVISLEKEHGPRKTKTLRLMRWKRHEGVTGLLCQSVVMSLFIKLQNISPPPSLHLSLTKKNDGAFKCCANFCVGDICQDFFSPTSRWRRCCFCRLLLSFSIPPRF